MVTRTELPLEYSPVRQARERLGLTLHGAAEKARINYQTWYNTECCCYALPPVAVITYLEGEGFSSHWLLEGYSQYRERSRNMFLLNYSGVYQFILEEEELDVHPVVWFREHLGLSRQGFAKELCIQPAVLYKVESGKTGNLPAQLREALEDVDVPVGLIDWMKKETKKWRIPNL